MTRAFFTWRGSSGGRTVKKTFCIAERASMRRRRPKPAVVRHRWAVNSVRQVTVLSLSVTTFFFAPFFLPLIVALRMSDADLVQLLGRDGGLPALLLGLELLAVELVGDLLGLAAADLRRQRDGRAWVAGPVA